MAKAYVAPILSAALKKFKQIVREHEDARGKSRRLVVFCEDRLSLVAERAVCEEVGGTFDVSVFTLSRFLSQEKGSMGNALTSQGSAMVIRRLIERHAQELNLFRRLSSPAAAREVYDTIALLYSSGIDAEDIKDAEGASELLKRKLHDISLLYAAYSEYLKESGAVDRNEYLRALPEVISNSPRIVGADVLFLGFAAFTGNVRECVRACMETAAGTDGVFIGDKKDVRFYQNEALADFLAIAKETGRAVEIEYTPSYLPAEAEHLRRNIFNPDSLNDRIRGANSFDMPVRMGSENPVVIAEAADEEEECAYIAAHILKCVDRDNIKPHRISVMIPDPERYQPILERVFNQYSIPFYVDRRYPLTNGFICPFVCDYIAAAADGMRAESVLAVVGNPLFRDRGGEKEGEADSRTAKDLFVNYILRAASSRAGVAREINKEVCADMCKGGSEADAERAYNAVCDVRDKFLAGRKLFPAKGDGAVFCAAIRALLKMFDIEKKLAEDSADEAFSPFPSLAAMSAKSFGQFSLVLDEAEKLTSGEVMSAREFLKMLKSGLAATEISLIPPKRGAVFVGDISSTVNAGSDIIFAAGLTDAVPKASQDTSLLTDGELMSLEKLNKVSPKISQLNRRVRETSALNVCAFSRRLYLTYPLRSGGEMSIAGEVISYARSLFTIGGKHLSPASCKSVAAERENLPYYLSNAAAALGKIAGGGGDSFEISTIYALLGDKSAADNSLSRALALLSKEGAERGKLTLGKKLYGGRISPTALETFFSCPYKCFMQQGLRLEERREGEIRPLDSGNFIHAVLEETAKNIGEMQSAEECAKAAGDIAGRKLGETPYSALSQDGRGQYTAASLVEEAKIIARGMYEQLAHSSFVVSGTERECSVPIGEGLCVSGRIDRIDTCGDMVRVIDYKTGYHDNKAESYYMGLKLQLPLYLTAASAGKRAAGAYYFPANTEYSSVAESSFCLKGFMDGSEDVVRSSDDTVAENGRSAFVDAYLNGRKLEGAMEREEFADFLDYSRLISESGAKGMSGGFSSPSPVEGACAYCAFSGCCMYESGTDGVREIRKANCSFVASVAREKRQKGGE